MMTGPDEREVRLGGRPARRPARAGAHLWWLCLDCSVLAVSAVALAAWLVPASVPLWQMAGFLAVVTVVAGMVTVTSTGSRVLASYLAAWGVFLGGWLAAARLAGVWTGDVIAALVTGFTVLFLLGPPTIAQYQVTGDRNADAEERARVRAELGKWETMFARIGVRGVQVVSVTRHVNGLQVHGYLGRAADEHGMVTFDSLRLKAAEVATDQRLANDAAHFEQPDPDNSAAFVLHLRTRKGKRKIAYLPESDRHTTVNKPLDLGLHDNGHPFRMAFRWIAVMIIGVIDAGKALALDTPLATPSGWTTMGDVQVGDWVFNEAGQPCRVIAATEVMHNRPCYEVEFSDGTVITADARHQWLVDTVSSRRSEMRARGVNRNPRRCPDLPGLHWNHGQEHLRKQPEIRTTEQMVPDLRAGPGARTGLRADGRMSNFSVRVAASLQCPDADLPVPPYTLGAWLGDGATVTGSVTSADREIISEIEAEGNQVRVVPSAVKERHASYRVAGLNVRLRAIGVLGNKHIPVSYLRASEEQRRALLAGLLDTDGYCTRRGAVEFCSTRERLARDVYQLACGLGYKATLRSKTARCDGKDCGTAWTVAFMTADKVFRLPRKLARQVTQVRPSVKHRYVTAIRPVPSVPVRCIEVDSPSHLYLAGESFVPTHNSNLLGVIIGQLARCEDVVIAAVDLKGGLMVRPWIQPWIDDPGTVKRPVIDWVAMTRMDTKLMLEALLAGGEARANSGMVGEKVTPRRDLPGVALVMDETAVATGHDRRDEGVRASDLATLLTRLVETYRALAFIPFVAAVRGDVETMGKSAIKAQALARIGLRVSQSGDGDSIFPDDHAAAKELVKITDAGAGLVLFKGKMSPQVHFFRITPKIAYRLARKFGPYRPAPDPVLQAGFDQVRCQVPDANGKLADRGAYESRWERMAGQLDTWRVTARAWKAEVGIREDESTPGARAVTSGQDQAAPGNGSDEDYIDSVLRDVVTETIASIEDPQGRIHPARRRMRELLRQAGPHGLRVGMIAKHLAAEAQSAGDPELKVHRNTLMRWLRLDEEAGRARREGGQLGDPYARWTWTWLAGDYLSGTDPAAGDDDEED